MSTGPTPAERQATLVIDPALAMSFQTDPPPGLLFAKTRGITGHDRQAILNPIAPKVQVHVKHQDEPYGKLMADLDALLNAQETRCSKEDEEKSWLLVMHQTGVWPIPFDRLERLTELKFITLKGSVDNKDVEWRLAMPRDRCEYWIDQWNRRLRQYTPPPEKTG